MSHALYRNTPGTRGGLLAVVIGAHVLAGVLLISAKTLAPQVAEIPMIVDFLQDAPRQPQAKPQPVVKPQIAQPKAPPQATKLNIEATASTVATNNAPVVAISESKPAPLAASTESVSQARFDADYLKNPAPAYPPLARRMGEEGKVVLRVSVTPLGTADSVEIKTSSGSQRLDDAAQKTVRNWRFVPAKRGETALQSWVLVPIIFKLEQ
jgi:protein TonB